MSENALVNRAVFSRRRSTLQQLVENRTLYESHGADLSIYDTFHRAEKVRLDAEEILYCGMISGRKILHGKQHFHSTFVPHESFLMAPNETVDIDFPDATPSTPTSCLTLGIRRQRLRELCDQLNHRAPLPRELGEWAPRHDQVLHLFHTEATQQLLVRIVDSFLSHDSDRDLVLNLGVTELLTRMLRQKGRAFLLQCARHDPTLIGLTEVVRYIDDNLDQHIDIDVLCRLACMSRSKLYQQFRDVMAAGPKEYIQQRRLERARELLGQGRTVTEACYEVGYVSASHFSRRFHRQYGVSPRQYARSCQPHCLPPMPG
ncbi:MAG: AraC family transcriptional regulator N-terminal domain-containing protein [Alcanivorax sp.]|nr:AraC family transcriptional regulator N-terminal domain-containing protein [Alcanivorax sp.]